MAEPEQRQNILALSSYFEGCLAGIRASPWPNRYGIPPFPKTVYRTPNPEYGISEAYELRTPGPKWLKRAGHFSRQR